MPTSGRHVAEELSTAELAALRGAGALKDEVPVNADSDPLLRSKAHYMALLEESLSAAEAAKLLRVDVTQGAPKNARALPVWSRACRASSSSAASSFLVSPGF